MDRARDVFERAASYVTDLGLLAEEVDAATGELLGNYPQAFSHIGLVNAAWAIDQAERAAAGTGAPVPGRRTTAPTPAARTDRAVAGRAAPGWSVPVAGAGPRLPSWRTGPRSTPVGPSSPRLPRV